MDAMGTVRANKGTVPVVMTCIQPQHGGLNSRFDAFLSSFSALDPAEALPERSLRSARRMMDQVARASLQGTAQN